MKKWRNEGDGELAVPASWGGRLLCLPRLWIQCPGCSWAPGPWSGGRSGWPGPPRPPRRRRGSRCYWARPHWTPAGSACGARGGGPLPCQARTRTPSPPTTNKLTTQQPSCLLAATLALAPRHPHRISCSCHHGGGFTTDCWLSYCRERALPADARAKGRGPSAAARPTAQVGVKTSSSTHYLLIPW